MIRRDYILRMIEEFFRVLSRIRFHKKQLRWAEAEAELDAEFIRLLKAGGAEVANLTETELLARIIQGEPTQAVHDKTLMISALLKESGDLAAAAGKVDEARAQYLKGLHLLLNVSRGEVLDLPEYVPTIEQFVSALADAPLSIETQARLMQHYESAGDFAKAEDRLFAILESEPADARLVEFGRAFYRRLDQLSDAALESGNLPRSEVSSGLAELSRRS